MVRSSKSAKKIEMTRGNNAKNSSSPYNFRHSTRESPKLQLNDPVASALNENAEPTITITNDFKNKRTYCTYCVIGTLAILHCVVLIGMLFPYPLHASCIIKWRFGEPCTYVTQKLRSQIINWSSWNTCRQRDRNCLYTLKSATKGNVIKATHMISNLKSHEKIRIAFEEVNNTCLATADSISSDWFTIFDYGINYCNLHDLVVSAGLDRHTKFLEITNDAVCTQFSMAVCG